MATLSRRDMLRLTAGAAAGIGIGKLDAEDKQEASPGKTLRVGQIGVGGRGSGLLGEYSGLPGVEVAAICDIDEGNRERALDRIEKATGRRPDASGEGGPYQYRRLLARKDIDCVVIATPCYWHSVMYTDALEAGMSFYGEKPLAITAGGIRSVLAARAKAPRPCIQIGFQWGAHPGRRDIFRRVREGEIGELLEGRFQRPNGWDGHGGWYAKRELSGDWMLEQAVHEFNLIWSTVRTHPLKAYAAGHSGVIPGRDTTNYYTAILKYPGKLIVHYSHGWIEVNGFPAPGMRTEFVGTTGAADIMGAFIQLRQAPAGGSARIEGKGGSGETKEHFLNFFECVRAGTPERTHCGVENGVGASVIGLMIRKSLEEGREVTYEEAMADGRKLPLPAEPA